MNDRFKFRVWDKIHNRFLCVDNQKRIIFDYENKDICVLENIKNSCWLHIPYDECVLMQYTGLKDKNGTLIYEGDIVEVQYIGGQIPLFKNEFSREPETERFEIFCHPEWLKFYAKNDNYRKTCEIHSLDLERIRINTDNKTYEVIGNIYENPELLKEDIK